MFRKYVSLCSKQQTSRLQLRLRLRLRLAIILFGYPGKSNEREAETSMGVEAEINQRGRGKIGSLIFLSLCEPSRAKNLSFLNDPLRIFFLHLQIDLYK